MVKSVVRAEALGTEKCCDIHIGMVMMYRYPPENSSSPLENRLKNPKKSSGHDVLWGVLKAALGLLQLWDDLIFQ